MFALYLQLDVSNCVAHLEGLGVGLTVWHLEEQLRCDAHRRSAGSAMPRWQASTTLWLIMDNGSHGRSALLLGLPAPPLLPLH